ncbi:hypothetical protein Cop2CBH44_32310 [Coprobacter secundus subsp. similis]|uniref:Uncharacterized protein n=1 Tax=Coprobacter secundus subsp. similis TaxID=2751153 RepID=A0A7G1I3G8_9BACT|nr:hypothetical protein Cop2CBH44_32310 [Coprobacter secundus subsp. similis]
MYIRKKAAQETANFHNLDKGNYKSSQKKGHTRYFSEKE